MIDVGSSAVTFLLIWIALGFVGAGLTTWVILRAWKRRKDSRVTTKLVVLLVAAAALFGALATLIGLVKAMGAVGGESVDPSQKARILAEGISVAINCTALGVLVWIPSFAVALVLTRKSKGP